MLCSYVIGLEPICDPKPNFSFRRKGWEGYGLYCRGELSENVRKNSMLVIPLLSLKMDKCYESSSEAVKNSHCAFAWASGGFWFSNWRLGARHIPYLSMNELRWRNRGGGGRINWICNFKGFGPEWQVSELVCLVYEFVVRSMVFSRAKWFMTPGLPIYLSLMGKVHS